MINSAKIPRAYSEVYSFLNVLGNYYINKIPDAIYDTIKENRDKSYTPIYDKNENITQNSISQEGLALISALNLQYWCNDEEEKTINDIKTIQLLHNLIKNNGQNFNLTQQELDLVEKLK